MKLEADLVVSLARTQPNLLFQGITLYLMEIIISYLMFIAGNPITPLFTRLNFYVNTGQTHSNNLTKYGFFLYIDIK